MNRTIIQPDGSIVPMDTAISPELISSGRVSAHVSTAEASVRDGNGEQQETDFSISAVILEVFEILRAAWKRPLTITSAYRSAEKQQALRMSNPNAAALSPHEYGMALDIGADGPEMVDALLKILREIRKTIPIRVGWKEYRERGYHFLHVDVCPVYFGISGPWFSRSCPKQWRTVSEW